MKGMVIGLGVSLPGQFVLGVSFWSWTCCHECACNCHECGRQWYHGSRVSEGKERMQIILNGSYTCRANCASFGGSLLQHRIVSIVPPCLDSPGFSFQILALVALRVFKRRTRRQYRCQATLRCTKKWRFGPEMKGKWGIFQSIPAFHHDIFESFATDLLK